jgi:predicted  nucleic acid-binding Zn-ribbon protein
MAWYRNHYECSRCGHEWEDEWSCMCDDDCPSCGARHMTLYDSDELTEVIEEDSGEFVVLWSPEMPGTIRTIASLVDLRRASKLSVSWPQDLARTRVLDETGRLEARFPSWNLPCPASSASITWS